MPGFGLDYNVLKEVKPDIIMVSVPGFGSTGRIKIIFLMRDGAVNRRVGSFVRLSRRGTLNAVHLYGRPGGGMYGVLAVCSAVYYHHKTGKGQHVELAQSEAIMSLLPEVVMEYEMTGRIRPRMGNRDEIMARTAVTPVRAKINGLPLPLP